MFRLLASIAVRSFYRLTNSGSPPSRTGPALLLANHPNSLFDPALVLASAGRPVRFLAKAPLFEDARVGWLVKLARAIPVYRQSDDPSAMGGNQRMFEAVDRALLEGSAIGLFPEGRSHSEPSIGELRTGAARMALSAATQRPGGESDASFPIVPIGLVFRTKETFRSDAAVVFGEPVEWNDLAERGEDDQEAVRELTARIDAALREVTVNLERWEDQPFLEGAVDVWGTEQDVAQGLEEGETEPRLGEIPEAERVRRIAIAAALLAETRSTPETEHSPLVVEMENHLERLSRLGLSPRQLWSRTSARVAVGWASRRFYLLGAPMLLVAVVGWIAFRIPNFLTGVVTQRTSPNVTELATHKLVVGALLNALWLLAIFVTVGFAWSWLGALAICLVLPAIGAAGHWVRVRWQGALADAKRFLMLRSRRDLVGSLRKEQRRLAIALEALVLER